MALSGIPEQELEAIHELGRTIEAARIALVVGMGIFATDYMHTLTREVRFYWSGRVSIPRILYFIIRYVNIPIQIFNAIGFFSPPNDAYCTAFVNLQLSLDLLLIWSVQAILIFRIRAAYGSNFLGTILWCMLSLVIASEAALGYVGVNLHTRWMAQPLPSLFPRLRFCFPNQAELLQRTHYLTWVPTLIFDFCVFLLSLNKFIQLRSQSVPGVFKKSLMWTLLHDSIVYFALLLIMAIVYMVVARINVENGEATSNIVFPLISAAGCRLLFHIRSREREKVLGLDDTALGRDNISPLLSEEFVASRPIEFRVFERNGRRTGELESRLSGEIEFAEREGWGVGDLEEVTEAGREEVVEGAQIVDDEEIRDPPRHQVEDSTRYS